MIKAMAQSVVLLAFANDPMPHLHLRYLRDEMETIEKILLKHPYLDVRIIPFATVDKIMDRFQDFHNRVVAFHYAGHASSQELMLLGPNDRVKAANTSSLADFLGLQKNLQLVFLNGCATIDQVAKLQESGINHIVATVGNITDKKAYIFARRFYKNLIVDDSINNAFYSAKANIQVDNINMQIGVFRGFIFDYAETDKLLTKSDWKLFQIKSVSASLVFEKKKIYLNSLDKYFSAIYRGFANSIIFLKSAFVKMLGLILIIYSGIQLELKTDILIRYYQKGDSPIEELIFPSILFVVGLVLILKNVKNKKYEKSV